MLRQGPLECPVARPLASDDLDFIRQTSGSIQRQLDTAGEVFLDESAQARP